MKTTEDKIRELYAHGLIATVLLGKPGAGKGTQRQLLMEYLTKKLGLKCQHLETGERFRGVSESDLTERAKEILNKINKSGDLQPAIFAKWLWTDFMLKGYMWDHNLIFDGAIRDVKEIAEFEEVLALFGIKPIYVYLLTGDSIAEERVLEREKNNPREENNTAEKRQIRMEKYYARTKQVVEDLEVKPNFIVVDGDQTKEEVFDEILEALAEVSPNQ